MTKIQKKTYILMLCFISLIVFSSRVPACQVPVFRYALEQWLPDIYEIFIFHNDSFSETDISNIEWLKKNSVSSINYSNFRITTIDIEAGIPDGLRELWGNLDSHELPRLAVMYPRSTGIKQVVWHGKLTADNAKSVVHSPARQKVAERILDSDSIVWILLEGSDRMANDTTADTLQTCLKKMGDNLLLPEQNFDTIDQFGNVQETARDIHVKISMIRLSREEAAEFIFINMLMYSEPDLLEYSSYPMAFPVYGRGRILYALIGKGINEQNIYRACSFLTGPCSCEVKAENPGVDLLMPVNWEAGIAENAPSASPLFRNSVVTLISIVLAIAVVSLKIVYRKSENT